MYGTISYVLVYVDPKYGGRSDVEDAAVAKMDHLRRRFLVAMRRETLVVAEERVGKHIFLKITCPTQREHKEAEEMRIELPMLGLVLDNPQEEEEALIEKKMKKIFHESDADSHAAAPFQRECLDYFTRRENPSAPILWSSVKCLLTYNILNNINISRYKENGELPEKIGLAYLLMVGAYKDGFCAHDPSELEPVSMQQMLLSEPSPPILTEDRIDLRLAYLLMVGAYKDGFCPHDPSELEPVSMQQMLLSEPSPPILTEDRTDLRRELSKHWGILCRRQPIHEIRDYFGEKIAFYFAWVSTLMNSLWIPAILGLGVFIYGVTRRLDGVKSKGAMYFIDIVKSSSDNDLTPAFAAIICLWGTIFMEVWKRKQISLAHKWHVENFDHVEPDRPQFYGTRSEYNRFTNRSILYYPFHKKLIKYLMSVSVLLLMVMLVFISVTSVILYRVYMTISFCAEGDSACDLLHGTILATLLNTISIMILGKIYEVIAVKLTEWENHQTLSEHNDALVVKFFAFQFANTYASLFYTAFFRRDFGTGIMGLDRKYTDNCGHSDNANCMSLLSFQLLVLMIVKPLPKFTKDVVWPWIKKILRRCRVNEIDDFMTDEGVSKQNYLLRELLKPSAEDFRLGEFTEKIIQYGYLVLFAASFPLAPALALVFNVFDFRIDARRLLWWNRRPTPYRDNDIGIWFHIIDFINVCGVISNSFLIAFNSELGRDKERYIQFAIIIGFEHFIFFIKFTISLIIPDVPTWVKNSQKKERYLLSYLMKRKTSSRCESPDDSMKEEEDAQNGDIPLHIIENKGGSIPHSRWSY